MGTFLQDLRYGARLLAKNRGFAAAAVLSLALGIGANTAIFSVVNAVLLQPMPFAEPERLVVVWGENTAENERRNQVSATDIADVRTQNTVFEEVATFGNWTPAISGDGAPERIPGMQVGDGYFDVMKATPALGRLFVPEEQEEGKDFVIVLSHGLWQRRFAGDPAIVGRTITLNNHPYTVVGVLPADFSSLPSTLVGPAAELYRPVAEPYDDTQRDARHLRAIARLKPSVSLESAQAELDIIAARLAAEHPDEDMGNKYHPVLLREDTVGNVRPALLTLLGAVAFVLLITCANVGNLLLARSIGRRKEIAIRATLGASRWRLARQVLTESVLLALVGGIAGLLLAVWGTSLVAKLGERVLPSLAQVDVDWTVLGFTLVVSVVAGLAFGAAPALHAAKPDLGDSLKDGGRTSTSGGARGRLRGALVVVETALALVLLVCAGLLLRSVGELRGVDPGFDPRNVLTMNVSLPSAKYPDAPARMTFYDRLVENARALPGVEEAGITSVLPVSSNFDSRGIEVEGRTYGPGEEPSPDAYFVTPGYLRALAISVLQGRTLTQEDTATSVPVALVSETMARRLWPGDDALGKRFRLGGGLPGQERPWRTVVGVVADVRRKGLDIESEPAFYVPYAQFPLPFMTLTVRTTGDPAASVSAVRREIAALDPDQAVFGVATMESLVNDSMGVRRFATFLLGLFAAVALALAAIGIYGVISYGVSQRTHEIGVRMALGAQSGDVVRLVVGQGLGLSVAGVVVGLGLAYAMTRLLSGLLFGVSATDPTTFAATAGLLVAVAIVASAVPAWRAARVDPTRALRGE
jgi:putative ABC transport system permease protein